MMSKQYAKIATSLRVGALLTTLLFLVVVLAAPVGNVIAAPTAISGTVYRDFNANGTQDTYEPGVDGLTVTAYPTSATGSTGGVSTTTAGGGAYSLSPGAGNWRIEVTDLSSVSYLYEGAAGSTTTVFVSDGATVDIGVNNPAQYCQANPDAASPVLAAGDPTGSGTSIGYDGWVMFPDTASGIAGGGGTAYTLLSPFGSSTGGDPDIGPMWGEAYHRSTGTLFASSLLRRHAGLGSFTGTTTTTGGIYSVDAASGGPYTVAGWLDINTLAGVDTGADPRVAGLDDIDDDAIDPSADPDALTAVGKIGIGDIEISEDDKTLYAVNLNQKSVVAVDIATKALVSTTTVSDPGCSNGDYQPWGLAVHDGEVYVGVVCTAETSQSTADLHAYVVQLGGSSVLDFALGSHTRGYLQLQTEIVFPASGGDWQPWSTQWSEISKYLTYAPGNTSWYVSDATPILSDIQFDADGSMILGFIDRTALQIGFRNNDDTVPTGGPYGQVFSGGDIARACPNGSGGWTLESNATCGGVTTGGAGNSEGFGGGEFYYEDNYIDTSNNTEKHQQVATGGLALLPGSNQVISTVYDPIHGTADTYGYRWFDSGSGQENQGYQIFESTGRDTFSKAQALGDVEYLCEPAPLEIGNRLWCDTGATGGGNGVQDPDETVVNDGVIVTLECDTDGNTGNGYEATATTTTSGGDYSFQDGSGNVTTGNGFPTAGWDGSLAIIPRDASCRILIDPTQAGITTPCGGSTPAPQDNGGADTGTDLRDSDGAADHDGAGNVGVDFTTGGSGENDHTFDFGFMQDVYDFGDAPDRSTDAGYPNQTILNGGARHLLNSTLVLGTCVDSESDGVPVTPPGSAESLIPDTTDDGSTGTASPYGNACASSDDEDGFAGVNDADWSDNSGSLDVEVSGVSGNACVYAWIDFDRNGFDAGDVSTSMLYTSDGTQEMVFDSTAVVGSIPDDGLPIYVRLRVVPGTCGTIDPTGLQTGGEVEDHDITSATTTAIGFDGGAVDAPITNLIWIATSVILLLLAWVWNGRRKKIEA